jgi:hypothetical protein
LWLLVAAGLVWIVCLAPPWLVKVWGVTPMMNNIVHLFYFYSHYLQLLFVLLAATVLDRALAGRLSRLSAGRLSLALKICCTLALLVIAATGLFTERFPAADLTLEAILLAAGLALIGAFAGWQCLTETRTSRRYVLCGLLVAVLTADLTRYYWEVSGYDQKFTLRRFGYLPGAITSLPLSAEVRAALKRPWQMPRDSSVSLFDNLPIPSDVWPNNTYNRHRYIHELMALPEQARQHFTYAPLALDVHEARVIACSNTYNDHTFDFFTPHGCLATVGLLPDPAWHVTLDDRPVHTARANVVSQSVSVPAGTHRLHFSYQPLSRKLFWPACWMLEATLVGLAVVAVRSPARRRDSHPLAGPWYRRKKKVYLSGSVSGLYS